MPNTSSTTATFTVGQTLYREKTARHSWYEGEVTVVTVGRKWVSVKAPTSSFVARFDATTMREDNGGTGISSGQYWLSKADCDAERAAYRAWDGFTSRFRDSFRRGRPAHIGLAEIAQIEAILDGKPAPAAAGALSKEIASKLVASATDLMSEVHAHLDGNDDDDMQEAYDALGDVLEEAEKALKGEG